MTSSPTPAPLSQAHTDPLTVTSVQASSNLPMKPVLSQNAVSKTGKSATNIPFPGTTKISRSTAAIA